MSKKDLSKKYLALLRGINVGGSNIIKMSDLKKCFESLKLTDVVTYIQSGNVVFTSDINDKNKLTGNIEKALSKTFNYTAKVVVISYKDLKKIMDDKPDGFGSKPAEYRYDVIFLIDPLKPKEAIKKVKTKEGVDEAYAGRMALYFSRLIAKAAQSYLSKVVSLPEYKFMTIRNWNTTTKLLSLMEKN